MTRIDKSIAVFIVNYGAADYIIQTMSTLLDELAPFTSARVLIADNRAPGDDLKKLQRHIDRQDLGAMFEAFDTGGNLGFAGGNNACYARLADEKPDLLFFLNPDASPTPGALAQLAETLDQNPDAAIVGPKICDETGDAAFSVFDFPCVFGQFTGEVEIGVLHRLAGQKYMISGSQTGVAPIEAGWVSGAAFMLRSSACPAPPMDDGYFLYFEETDMMKTLADEGWRILFDPRAVVVHIGGLTTGAGADPRGNRLPAFWYDSWRRYSVRHFGAAGAMLAGTLRIIGIVLYYLKQAIRGEAPRRPKRYLRDFFSTAFMPIFTRGGD